MSEAEARQNHAATFDTVGDGPAAAASAATAATCRGVGASGRRDVCLAACCSCAEMRRLSSDVIANAAREAVTSRGECAGVARTARMGL